MKKYTFMKCPKIRTGLLLIYYISEHFVVNFVEH